MRIILLIVCFAISETISARLERSPGGRTISIEDAPYFVSIKESGHHKCCGALVTWKHVLTAACCMVDVSNKLHFEGVVVSGTDHKHALTHTHTIRKFTVHPLFMINDTNPFYDIAVLTLSGLVPNDGKHWPISFPIVPPVHLAEGSLIAFREPQMQNDQIYLQALPVVIRFPNRPFGFEPGDDPKYSFVFEGEMSKLQAMERASIGGPLIYDGTVVGVASRMVTKDGRLFMNVYECSSFISEALSEI